MQAVCIGTDEEVQAAYGSVANASEGLLAAIERAKTELNETIIIESENVIEAKKCGVNTVGFGLAVGALEAYVAALELFDAKTESGGEGK